MPITTSSEQARKLFLEGRDLGERHRGDLARVKFEEAVACDSQFALAYLQLARVYSDAEAKAQALNRAVQLAPSVSEGENLQISAYSAFEKRNTGEAAGCFLRLLKLYPNDPRVRTDYANHLYWRKNWSGAIDQYLTAIALAPEFAQPHNGLGYCYRFQGNLGAAERHFLIYLEMVPDDPNPYDSYADLMTEMNRNQEAIAFYEKALEIDPGFTASHLGIASNYNILGDFVKARQQLEQCLVGPFSSALKHEAMVALAVSHVFEGRLDEAARRLSEAADSSRARGDSRSLVGDYGKLGLVWLEAGQPDEAARVFVQALQVAEAADPSTSGITVQNAQLDHQQRMALVWLVRGELESAAVCARTYYEMVEPMKDQALIQQAHLTNGLIALARGVPDEAVAELGQSDLTVAYNQYQLATALERIGNFTQALKYYRQASDFDQLNTLTHAFVYRRAEEKVNSMLALLRNERPPITHHRADSLAAPALAVEPAAAK